MGGWQRQARSHLARWRGALTAGGWHDPGGRRSARDWAADAALFAAAAAVGGLASDYLWPTHSLAVNVLGLAAGGLACLAVWLRRTRPAAALGAIAASAFSPLALGAALIAIFTVAARAHGRILAAAAALTTLASVAFPLVNPAAGAILTQRFPAALLPAAAFGWGLFAGARRDLLVSLRERARQLEAGQQRSAQLAREAERRRIARDMHDVLAHRLSLLSVHAGALEFRPDATAAEVSQAARVIRSSASAALSDLREVIAVLRDDAPQPGLAGLPALIEESRAAGMTVRADIAPPDAGPLPAALGRTAYRVVQEGLTNARKHAPGAAVSVTVTGHGRRGLLVEVISGRPASARAQGTPPPRNGQRAHRPGRAAQPRRGHAGARAEHSRGVRAARHHPGTAMTGRIRVLLADDDALVRAGLRMMLAGAGQLEVVGEAASGRDVLAACDLHHPDVVLMDLRMPQLDGIAATRLLRRQPRPPQVLVLTTFDADELVLRALQAGASGFLLKDTAPDAIVRAIEAVHAGEGTLSPAIARRLIALVAGDGGIAARQERARQRLASLTPREREIAMAVGEGHTNSEIAGQLLLSLATVKAHVSQLLTKLGVTNRVQIALLVHDAAIPPGSLP